MKTKLFWKSLDLVTLPEALQLYTTYCPNAIGLFYSPGSCCLVQIADNRMIESAEVDRQTVFEARVFNPQMELRWLNQNQGRGQAVLLSEQRFEGIANHELAAIATLDQTYILWGEGMSVSSSQLPVGWSRLATARTGKLDVPLAGVAPKQRVQLKVKEYLTVCDRHGNVVVEEERLLSLKAT